MAFHQFSQLHQLLIQEDFVRPKEVVDAYDLKNEREKLSQKPFCKILLKTDQLTKKGMNDLLNHFVIRKTFANLILNGSKITGEKLNNKMTAEKNTATFLKNLINDGAITEDQKKEMMNQVLDDINTARLCVEMGLISEETIAETYNIKHYKKSVCEILYDMRYVTLTELNHVFRIIDDTLKLGICAGRFGNRYAGGYHRSWRLYRRTGYDLRPWRLCRSCFCH